MEEKAELLKNRIVNECKEHGIDMRTHRPKRRRAANVDYAGLDDDEEAEESEAAAEEEGSEDGDDSDDDNDKGLDGDDAPDGAQARGVDNEELQHLIAVAAADLRAAPQTAAGGEDSEDEVVLFRVQAGRDVELSQAATQPLASQGAKRGKGKGGE